MSTLGCRELAIGAVCMLLGGCAVGPNFKRPAPPAVPAYLAPDAPKPASTAEAGSAAQELVDGMEIPAKWWEVFHSASLDRLVEQALRHNPTAQSAQAALRQADENYRAQLGTLLPAVDATYSFTRQKNATGTLQPTLTSGEEYFSLHTAQVSVSYVLDVFGGNRRQAESLRATADSQRYQLEATYLTLSSNVVTTAIQEASARAQLAASRSIVASEREALQILQHQFDLGSIAMTDVMAQQAALAGAEASLPPLEKQLEQAQHALATLAGDLPGERPGLDFDLPEIIGSDAAGVAVSARALQLPHQLPLSLPSRLVRQRPDVLSAEANLHAATAGVGVAIANMLPQFDLTGFLGGTSTQIQTLFATGNTFWSGGASLSQTIFQGGTLLHRERAARAAMDQAAADYRNTVLTAFQNVADTLTALREDAAAVDADGRAMRAARDSLVTVRRNVELGLVGYLALLNAQQTHQQAVLALAQAQANLYSDTAALFQALGGGWWDPAQQAEASADPAGASMQAHQ